MTTTRKQNPMGSAINSLREGIKIITGSGTIHLDRAIHGGDITLSR
jgi:hypothetical protein